MRNFIRCVLGGGALGLFLAVFWSPNSIEPVADWFFLLLFLLIALTLTLAWSLSDRESRLLLYVAVIFIGTALGLGRFWLSLSHDHQDLAFLAEQKVTIQGVVVTEPDIRDTSTRLVIKPETKDFKILVTAPLYPVYQYGDKLELVGKLQVPENFATDQEREFDYINYLAKDDIYYQLYQPQVKLLARRQGNWLIDKLLTFKTAFLNKINLILPEPESSLLAGLLLGVKQSLGNEWLERFRTAGVSHIIVLSGYNLTIIADSLIKFFSLSSRLPRAVGWSGGALAIVLFAIMTGGGATVVRASIMALTALFARATGRVYDAANALFLAAFLMVALKPKILIYDIGFQLSFLATLGLIYLSPALERRFSWLAPRKLSPLNRTWWFKFKESWRGVLISTLSAQIAVLPWILYKMGLLSLVSLPANLLILITIPFTMLFGFIAASLAFISTYLAWPFALLAHGLLTYQLFITKLLSNLPLAAVTIPYFPWWAVIICYVALGWWVRRVSLLNKT